MRFTQFATSLCMVFATITALPAKAIEDQSNRPGPNDFGRINSNAPGMKWEQEVVPGISGNLTAIDLFVNAGAPLQQFRVFINEGTGWQTDDDSFTALVTPTQGLLHIDITNVEIHLYSGQSFVIGIEGLGPNTECCNLRITRDAYALGSLFLGGLNTIPPLPGADLAFVTYMSPVDDLPSPVALIAGLALLAARRRASAG